MTGWVLFTGSEVRVFRAPPVDAWRDCVAGALMQTVWS